MSLRRGLLLFAAMVLLFLLANRAAYKGYFSDDDLDNLVQTRGATSAQFAQGLVTPKLSEWNFRPVGHFYYKALGAAAGLNFRPYVFVLHALHIFNVWLVWLLLRRLGAEWTAATAGAAFFAFHMACFDAYWKPMFVFDVLCTAFLLATLLLYLRGHWLLALIPYWLAYKSKEPAIALPAVLLLYEFLLGERRWKRVLPYAAIAVSFGLQALFVNRGPVNNYSLVFTPQALWTTFSFYCSQILLIPYAGVLLIPLAFLVKDKRVRFGLASIALLLGPMWFLPGRLFAVYLYIPLIGAAIAFCFASERWKPAWIAGFFVLWIPFNYMLLRQNRGVTLAAAVEDRAFVESAGILMNSQPALREIVYDGAPAAMNPWGVQAAFAWHQPDPALRVSSLDSPEAKQLLSKQNLAVVSWDGARRRLLIRTRKPGEPDPPLIDMADGNIAWLFGDGWFPLTQGYRWMGPQATARLSRPADAREFVVRINFGPIQFKDQGRVELEVLLNGQSLGTREYKEQGWHVRSWSLPPSAPGPVEVTLRSLRPYHPSNGDPRTLGAAVVLFGFVP